VGGFTEVCMCHLLWGGRHSILGFRVYACAMAASVWAGHGSGPGDC